jgi:hypothetical protein
MEIQKEYNLRYLLAKVRTTWGKASDRPRQRANKRNKNRVGHLPTSEQNWKVILSDESDVGSERVNSLPIGKVSRLRRLESSSTLQWELQNSMLQYKLQCIKNTDCWGVTLFILVGIYQSYQSNEYHLCNFKINEMAKFVPNSASDHHRSQAVSR